jgi:hypothetical protein
VGPRLLSARTSIRRLLSAALVTAAVGSSAATAAPPPAVRLPGDIVDLQTQADLQAAEIDALETDLAAQIALNQRQSNQIVSLLRHIRSRNSAQNANQVRDGIRLRRYKVRALIRRRALGIIGPEVPATVLTEEIRRFRDLAERLRCRVVGVDQLGTDDCIDSEGTTIEEDEITVDVVVQASVTAYSTNVENWADGAQILVDDVVAVANTPECDLWAADPTNQIKEQLCYASLGIPTDDVLDDVLTAIASANQTADNIGYPVAVDPVCVDIITDGSSTCPDTSGASDLVGTWEGITVQGEDPFDTGACTIDGTYDWNC